MKCRAPHLSRSLRTSPQRAACATPSTQKTKKIPPIPVQKPTFPPRVAQTWSQTRNTPGPIGGPKMRRATNNLSRPVRGPIALNPTARKCTFPATRTPTFPSRSRARANRTHRPTPPSLLGYVAAWLPGVRLSPPPVSPVPNYQTNPAHCANLLIPFGPPTAFTLMLAMFSDSRAAGRVGACIRQRGLERPARSVDASASGVGTAPRVSNPVFSTAPPWRGA
jgi:hypothetical protein